MNKPKSDSWPSVQFVKRNRIGRARAQAEKRERELLATTSLKDLIRKPKHGQT